MKKKGEKKDSDRFCGLKKGNFLLLEFLCLFIFFFFGHIYSLVITISVYYYFIAFKACKNFRTYVQFAQPKWNKKKLKSFFPLGFHTLVDVFSSEKIRKLKIVVVVWKCNHRHSFCFLSRLKQNKNYK
jgi:hypothetical protein